MQRPLCHIRRCIHRFWGFQHAHIWGTITVHCRQVCKNMHNMQNDFVKQGMMCTAFALPKGNRIFQKY